MPPRKRKSSKTTEEPTAAKRSRSEAVAEEEEAMMKAEQMDTSGHGSDSGGQGGAASSSATSANDYPRPPRVEDLVEGDPGTPTGRPLRLYADGIFDMFHFGHARALQQCKQAYPNTYLLVGCCSDELTHELKGSTVMTDRERYEALRHCRWVDEVVEDAPWVITDEFLEEHKIDYVCHDALPYGDASGEAESGDVYARLKRMGKFYETKRTEGISTSDLLTRIIAQYDQFVRRNLDRGYSAKDMNVPFYKEQSIRLDMAVDRVKERAGGVVDQVKERTGGVVNKLDHAVDDMVDRTATVVDRTAHAISDVQHRFLMLFERQSPLRTKFRATRRQLQNKFSQLARESLC